MIIIIILLDTGVFANSKQQQQRKTIMIYMIYTLDVNFEMI